MKTRRFFLRACLAAGAFVAAAGVLRAQGAPPRITRITARKFGFEPNHIALKLNEPTVFELTTLDRAHGFEIPALGVAATILPGESTRIACRTDRAGKFGFACNNFCGDGHDDMDGEITIA